MAKLLDVSTSGYYGWFSRPESEREQERLLLDVLVKAAYEASRGRYGSLKISRALAAQGKPYSSPLKNYLSTHINGKDAWSAGQINQGKEIEQETLIRG